MFVVITSEWGAVDGKPVMKEIANVYGPFSIRAQAEKFRATYCYSVVACIRPVLKERLADKLEPQEERKERDKRAQVRTHNRKKR